MNQQQKSQLQANLSAAVLLANSIIPEIVKPKIEPFRDSPRALAAIVGDDGTWRISRNTTKVIFGCGAVKVNKSDLKALADYKELAEEIAVLQAKLNKINARKNVAVTRLTGAWQHSHARVTEEHVRRIPVNMLKGLIG